MNTHPILLRIENLFNLQWLQCECQDAPDRAADWFRLDADSVTAYAELTDGAVDSLCRELDVSLFVPLLDHATLPATLGLLKQPLALPSGSPLQSNNLRNIQAVCAACARSAGEAVWKYRIDHDTALAYAALVDDSALALAQSMASSFLVPRYAARNLEDILAKPAGTRGMFAAAIEVEVLARNEAGRRGYQLTH